MAGIDATIESIGDLEETILDGIDLGFSIVKSKGFSLEAGYKLAECTKDLIDLAVGLKPTIAEVMDIDVAELGTIAKRLAELGINVYKKFKP